MNKIYLKSIITGAILLFAYTMVLGLTFGFIAVITSLGGQFGGAMHPPVVSYNTFLDIYYWNLPITAITTLLAGGVLGALDAVFHTTHKKWVGAVAIVFGLAWLVVTWWFNFGIPVVAAALLLALVYTDLALRVKFKPNPVVSSLLHGTLLLPLLLIGSFSTTAAIYWTLPNHDPAAPIFLAGISLMCPGVGIILGSLFGAIEAYGRRHLPSKIGVLAVFSLLVIWCAYQVIGNLSFGLLPGLLLTAWILARAKHRTIKALLVGGCSMALLSTTVLSMNTTGLVTHFSSGLVGVIIAIVAAFLIGLVFAALYLWAYKFNRHNLAWLVSLAIGLVIGLFGSWQGLVALLLAIIFTLWTIKFSYDSVEHV